MSVFGNLKKGVEAILHPWENTKKSMEIGDAYSMYYRTTVVPLAVYVIISLLLYYVASTTLAFSSVLSPLTGLGWISAVAVPVAIVWALIPIGIFVTAAILHVVGRASGQFKGKFESTLTAVVYDKLPTAIFSFMLALPFALPVYLLFGLWGWLVGLAAVSNQQKISWITVIGVEVIAVALVVTVLAFFASLFAISIGASLGHWVMMHQMGVAAV